MDDMVSFSNLCDQLSFASVQDNIDAGIIIYDAQGNFLYMNTVMVN